MKASDGARIVMPLLRKIAAASLPVDIAELAHDPDLQALAERNWYLLETHLRWAADHLERQSLLVSAGEGRYAVTLAGLQRIGDLRDERISARRDMARKALAEQELTLRAELLARLYAMPPAGFELAVMHLVVGMGYGSNCQDLARRLGRTGDGGIDGEVPLDELGLDTVYVQAKRYRPGTAVAVGELRDFAGSLDQRRANKGIFATTGAFSRPAREFAAQASRRIVLIDGSRFCELMAKFGIGVRTVETWELKELDGNYFASAVARSQDMSQISSASIQPRR